MGAVSSVLSLLSFKPPGGAVQLVSVQLLKEAEGNPEYCEYLLGKGQVLAQGCVQLPSSCSLSPGGLRKALFPSVRSLTFSRVPSSTLLYRD